MESSGHNIISRNNVESMFDNIAPTYDLFNHLLSFGIDKKWRSKAIKEVTLVPHDNITDFATGTGDFAISMAKKLQFQQIYGLDISANMLEEAKAKANKAGLSQLINFSKEDCEATSIMANSIDVVTIGFGIRNFRSPQKGLCEMLRVLKPGGKVVILEFAIPKKGLFSKLVQFYYKTFIPCLGKLISGNKGAYHYLPATIYEFQNGKDFCEMMHSSGFIEAHFKSLSFNMVNLYTGFKPRN
ncbi:MAG: bifunctional demethylmenaquinone methyltransferase/2-methoxy-6-polyprenyl-1,4-benzoquinol methylase UbiE [Bacteroidales bacterium]|nr:bifunctional demethylmenaquinone methyltransferase/2-methoxy-6-polyprenyl-1,4-benzoquinol methylase UbiE [Bacteroidales bacterium]